MKINKIDAYKIVSELIACGNYNLANKLLAVLVNATKRRTKEREFYSNEIDLIDGEITIKEQAVKYLKRN